MDQAGSQPAIKRLAIIDIPKTKPAMIPYLTD
jgi:hypothetical protein